MAGDMHLSLEHRWAFPSDTATDSLRSPARLGSSCRPAVCVLVLSYNARQDTAECLQSVQHDRYANIDVFLIDNNSVDCTAEVMREMFPAFRVIETGANLGYAGGNNVGLRAALSRSATYALLLNQDTILAADSLDRLVEAAESHSKGAFFGPLVYHFTEPAVIQSAGGVLTRRWECYHRGQNQPDSGQYQSVEPVDWVTGCAILIRLSALERVGLLDPDFFMYSEEVEWCLRARRLGYQVMFVPTAHVWHKGVQRNYAPSPRVTYLSARNHLLLLKKHRAGKRALTRTMLVHLRTLASWSVLPRWQSQRLHRNALARALYDFWRGRFGPPPF